MKRQVFFSFHYANDVWRVGQIRNIGTIEGQEIFSDNGLDILSEVSEVEKNIYGRKE